MLALFSFKMLLNSLVATVLIDVDMLKDTRMLWRYCDDDAPPHNQVVNK